MNILIVDDNEQITSVLGDYGRKEGYEVIIAFDGEEAIQKFNSNKIDIVLLDVMMPKMNGYDVCREIRKVSNVPVIMITARGEDFDKIMGLDTGADDYIVKPFSPAEIMARIRAIMRRINRDSNNEDTNVIKYDNLLVNMNTYEVNILNQEISLTKKEIELLWVLVNNINRVFTRESLLDSVWGYDYYGDSRTVDSHIKRLRHKLEIQPHPNWEIKTIWGVGYKLEGK